MLISLSERAQLIMTTSWASRPFLARCPSCVDQTPISWLLWLRTDAGVLKYMRNELFYIDQKQSFHTLFTHWPQYMDSWLARFCILVNACHRKPLGSHFTPVKTLDRHTDLCTCQCMKCNRWQVFSFKFHETSGKKWKSSPDLQDS